MIGLAQALDVGFSLIAACAAVAIFLDRRRDLRVLEASAKLSARLDNVEAQLRALQEPTGRTGAAND